MSLSIYLVIPTYNEKGNIEKLLPQIFNLGISELHVLVVDDNSRDGTQQIAREMGERFGNVTLIARPEKLGLGSALKAGLIEALATDARFIMTMDADCSHDAKDVPRLLEAARRGDADLVQASRYISGGGVTGMPSFRRISSRLAQRWGWEAHKPSRWRRHFIKRFYGSYPEPLKPGSLIGA